MTNIVEITRGREVTINADGRVDDEAILAFTEGQCHALALALNSLANLPLVGIWGPYDDPEDGATPIHVLVQLPNGSLLDIKGAGAEIRWESWGGGYTLQQPLTKAKVRGLHKRDYVKPDLKAAKPFAQTLIKKYSKEINEANKQVNAPRSQETFPQAAK